MSGLLIDRPIAAAVADRRPYGPAWLVAPTDEIGMGCAGFARAFLLVPHFFPVSLDHETFSDAFRVYDPGKYTQLYGAPAAAHLAAHRSALVDAMPGEGVFVLGGSSNHFHWLTDFLPRLALLERAPELPSAALLVHSAIDATQRETVGMALDAAGLPPRALHPVPDGLIGIREAAVPTRVPRAAAVAFWRRFVDRLGLSRAAPTRRLLLCRGNVARRRLVDEPALISALAAEGFEAVDPGTLPLLDQIRLFAEAAVVAGVHGAALTGALFMAPGARVIELRHPDLTGEFRQIADAAGLDWQAVPVDPIVDPAIAPVHRDVRMQAATIPMLLGLLRRLPTRGEDGRDRSTLS